MDQISTMDRKAWADQAAQVKFEGRHFINGEFVSASAGGKFEKVNPANGTTVAEVARGDAMDVDLAVAAARRAFKSGVWSRMAPRSRMEILYRYAQLIRENALEFALLDTLDMGKPVSDMINSDVPGSASTFQYFAETIDKIDGQVTNTAASELQYILRQPLGVVGCVTPWNYPLMMAAWKVAPALAAGNTVVLKPAEQSPHSASLMARLFMEAGGPAGVFNVIQGLGHEAGQALALHMDVDKIAFTGSVEVGKLMLVYAGQSNMKRVTTECGGKTPQIIMGDVPDLDTAVTYAINGIFGNQGEVCNAGSRLLVDEKLHDDFVHRFLEKSKTAFTPGDPLDPSTTMGPLVTREQQKRVLGYIDDGVKEGANLALGGDVPETLREGAYVSPTLFTGVNNQMKIAREEIFGPVAAVLPIKDIQQAVEIANDSIYGLAASIWTSDLSTAHKAARDIDAGVVWVNCFDHGDMTQPWGGFKQSGNGRDKCFETMMHHTQTKSVWIHLG
ncbi:gamma-glutamyl-gamma-aminobutyraldehyde dehydrogenase [Rhodoligotrophos appendicifer]|uniref:aldehyde dehydrogenase n=1 Tax=Rhodoligotrophos appendicifer TaxID=987056 RepID=UPI001185FF3F|nr:aldehyde dehydrogenase [Rhodoligotrophos appendicifer]